MLWISWNKLNLVNLVNIVKLVYLTIFCQMRLLEVISKHCVILARSSRRTKTMSNFWHFGFAYHSKTKKKGKIVKKVISVYSFKAIRHMIHWYVLHLVPDDFSVTLFGNTANFAASYPDPNYWQLHPSSNAKPVSPNLPPKPKLVSKAKRTNKVLVTALSGLMRG